MLREIVEKIKIVENEEDKIKKIIKKDIKNEVESEDLDETVEDLYSDFMNKLWSFSLTNQALEIAELLSKRGIFKKIPDDFEEYIEEISDELSSADTAEVEKILNKFGYNIDVEDVIEWFEENDYDASDVDPGDVEIAAFCLGGIKPDSKEITKTIDISASELNSLQRLIKNFKKMVNKNVLNKLKIKVVAKNKSFTISGPKNYVEISEDILNFI